MSGLLASSSDRAESLTALDKIWLPPSTQPAYAYELEARDSGLPSSPDPESLLSPRASFGPNKRKAGWSYVVSGVWLQPVGILAMLYCMGLAGLLFQYKMLPSAEDLLQKMNPAGPRDLLVKIPQNFEELRRVKQTLELYTENYYMQVTVLLISVYLFLQTFMTPGCFFLNMLAGSMYGVPVAMVMVVLASTLGACINYWLSRLLVKEVVVGLFPERLLAFSKVIQQNRKHLINYLILIRVMPILPAWIINLASPIVKIPFREYFIGTAIGLQPSNFIAVETGRSLGDLEGWSDLCTWRNFCILGASLLMALLPMLRKWYLNRRKQQRQAGFGIS